jgi:dihydrofolate reductase
MLSLWGLRLGFHLGNPFQTLAGDIFVIGGAKTYESFVDQIQKWVVTEIPETVHDANVFMRKDFLEGFELMETLSLDGKLKVKTYEKVS